MLKGLGRCARDKVRGKGKAARHWKIDRVFNSMYHSHRQAFVFTRDNSCHSTAISQRQLMSWPGRFTDWCWGLTKGCTLPMITYGKTQSSRLGQTSGSSRKCATLYWSALRDRDSQAWTLSIPQAPAYPPTWIREAWWT